MASATMPRMVSNVDTRYSLHRARNVCAISWIMSQQPSCAVNPFYAYYKSAGQGSTPHCVARGR